MKRSTKDELAAYARTAVALAGGVAGAAFIVRVADISSDAALAWMVGVVCLSEILNAQKAQKRVYERVDEWGRKLRHERAREKVACPYEKLLDSCKGCAARAYAEAHPDFGGRCGNNPEGRQVSQGGGGRDE